MRHDFDELGIETIRFALRGGEVRTFVRDNAEIEWRVPGDAGAADEYRVLTGYPAVFNQPTALYEGKRYAILEQIAPGAFDDVLKDDCHINYVHESASAMARNGRSGIGGMELSTDDHGLRVYAQLPLDDWDVQRLAPKMDRGTVDQMSFAFFIGEETVTTYADEEGREVELYTILKVSRLIDVCVAPLGAYSQTEAALRSVYEAKLNGRAPAGRDALDSRSKAEGVDGAEGRSKEGSFKKRLLLLEGEDATSRLSERIVS